jgi:acyl carrier protein
MNIKEFIIDFSGAFDDTDVSTLLPGTCFKELDEWSSLCALAVMNIIDKKYDVKISNAELKSTQTIQDLFCLVESKKK